MEQANYNPPAESCDCAENYSTLSQRISRFTGQYQMNYNQRM